MNADNTLTQVQESASVEIVLKRKPGSLNPGYAMNGVVAPPIIAESDYLAIGNNYFNGTAMKKEPHPESFTKLYHSLYRHPKFRAAQHLHKLVFIHLLVNAAWAECTQEYYARTYKIEVGEIFISLGELTDAMNEGLGCKQYKPITKNEVRGAITFFMGSSWLTCKLTQPKYLLSIKYSMFCEQEKSHAHTNVHTNVHTAFTQPSHAKVDNLDTLDVKPKKKKPREPRTASLDAAALLVFFNSSLKTNIPEVAEPCHYSEASKFDDLIAKNYSPGEIRSVIEFAHTGFWAQHVHSVSYLKLKFTKLLAASRRRDQPQKNNIDRRTKNVDGTAVSSPADGRF